jgi:vacuolar-type H+-ATPase subunit H
LQQVIQKVLEAEAEAGRMVKRAKAEAEKILAEAQERAQQLMAQRRELARSDAEAIISTAARVAEEEKQVRMARATAEINTQVQLDQSVQQQVIDAVVACICRLK